MRSLKQIISYTRRCAIFSRSLHGSAGLSYEPRYNSDEQKKILKTLNDSSADELAEFAISKTRIERLKKFRVRNGPFNNLTEILEVEGLSVKTLERLCDSIISDKEPGDDGKKNFGKLNRAGLVTPSATFINRNSVRNIVALHVSRNTISWANLTRGRELAHWDMYELPSEVKSHLSNLYEVLVNVKNQLPQADLYVMEDVRYNLQHISDLQFYHLRTILYTLLNNHISCPSSTIHRVFFLRHQVPARMFERLVGNEKVTAQTVVSKILDSDCYHPITVDSSLRIAYSAKNSIERELLCEALLVAISFMDLILLRNVEK